ncbi:unnamed protein product [Allacma fusca]|uniref:G-protein coupled receptors family 1 profile domain-containing protein n=1 Tax=Allacma fusca TaxID=39272 RepID=A0A8J2JJK3_9HEXA|nr:unnamed protein product [Allacma fusca]
MITHLIFLLVLLTVIARIHLTLCNVISGIVDPGVNQSGVSGEGFGTAQSLYFKSNGLAESSSDGDLESSETDFPTTHPESPQEDPENVYFIVPRDDLENNHSVLVPLQNTSIVNKSSFALLMEKYPIQQWKSFGLFDETYLAKINTFWLHFEPASTQSHLIMGVLYIVIMTVGCSGNLLVIVMFMRFSSLRTPANYLILNLALSDFVMLVKMPVFIINSFYEGPVLGEIGCQVYGFLGGLTGLGSIVTIAAISIDRYFVIVHPMSPHMKTTRTRALLMICAVWLYSLFFSSLPLLGVNEYVSEGYLTSCSFDYLKPDFKSRLFIFIFFLAAWLLPLSFILFSYIGIFRVVVQAENTDFFNGGTSRESFKYNKGENFRKEVRIAMLTTIIVGMWVTAWTPYAIVALLGIFGQKHVITPFISTLPSLFCKASSCVNPFIYAINHPRFQKELRKDLRRLLNFITMNLFTRYTPNSLAVDATVIDDTVFFNRVRRATDAPQNNFSSFNITVHTHRPDPPPRNSSPDNTGFVNETPLQANELLKSSRRLTFNLTPSIIRTCSESNISSEKADEKKHLSCKSLNLNE